MVSTVALLELPPLLSDEPNDADDDEDDEDDDRKLCSKRGRYLSKSGTVTRCSAIPALPPVPLPLPLVLPLPLLVRADRGEANAPRAERADGGDGDDRNDADERRVVEPADNLAVDADDAMELFGSECDGGGRNA